MKELSIEEKAKRYDEAIERAKSKIKNDKDHVLYEYDILDIFPELKESEDEKKRKLCEVLIRTCFMNELCTKEEKDDCFAWLEKQGEQKPQRIISAEAKEAMYDKPAWSEEDENNLYLITTAVEQKYSGELFLGRKQKEIVCTGRNLLDWLNSLKERIK